VQEFKSQQLPLLVEDCKHQKFSGVINVLIETPQKKPRTRVIAFHQGWMTYAGAKLTTNHELAALLGRELKLRVMDFATKLADNKMKEHNSMHDYLELFVRLKLLQWQDIEAIMQTRLLGTLEQLIPYSGAMSLNPDQSFDLYYSESRPGFDWAYLQPIFAQRQEHWAALATTIPSIEEIPRALEIDPNNTAVVEHVQQWVDGQRSLVDIATELDRDPLKLAQLYCKWAREGWLTFNSKQPAREPEKAIKDLELPIVLSVDDSPVVQTMIKRAIDDRYEVLSTDNAVDAFNILNNNNVSLMLLDVTMPDINGLDLCRSIRSIAKFQHLPVVMLTAREGMVNKIKGQMAGATHYLTKPVTREKLFEVLEQYIPEAIVEL